jgi:hypothetical protein
MYNHFALALVALIGIVFLDDDPGSVSIQEWVLYGVLMYAAISFFIRYMRMIEEESKRFRR